MHTETQTFYEERILAVLVHIQGHLDDALDLETLGAVAHFSPFHFHRLFTAFVGDRDGRFPGNCKAGARLARGFRPNGKEPPDRVALCGKDRPGCLERFSILECVNFKTTSLFFRCYYRHRKCFCNLLGGNSPSRF